MGAPRPIRSVLATLSLALPACGAETADVWLGLPAPDADAKTLLVGVPERSSARVFVADAAKPADVALELEGRAEDDGDIEAAYLSASLEAAGLTAGWQAPPSAGAARRALALGSDALLGTPSQTFRAALFDDDPAWVPTERLSAAIAGFEVEVEHLECRPLHAPSVSTSATFDIAWASRLSERLVVMGDVDHTVRVFSLDDGRLSGVAPGLEYSGGDYRDGFAYLGDPDGRVWRGVGHRETVLEGAVQLGERLTFSVRAVAAGGADDVFALESTGDVSHYDGERWTHVGRADDARLRLEWIGPRQAILLADTTNIVYVVTPDSLRAETVAEAGILSVALVPGLGVLAGTSDGEILQRKAGGWGKLGEARYGWWLLDIAPFAGGATFLLASGSVTGFLPETGDCEDLFSSHIITRGWLLPQGDGLLWVGKKDEVPEIDVYYLETL